MGRRAAPPPSEPTGPKGAGFRPAQMPAGPKLPRPLSALYPRFRPGAGGGAAAVRAQTEMMIPQKFPACALPGAESFSTFFGHSLEEKGGLCMKKKWTIAAVLVLAVALLAVGTWAYFSAVGRADNVITMGSVKLALHDEDGTGQPFTTVSAMPGSVVDKVVYVENVGSGAFYTRVKITPEVVAANGELVPLTDRSLLTLDLNDTDWIPGTDGYYYYNGTLSPKAATSKLFNHVTFSKDMGNEYQNTTVHIYVTAEAVQTANLDKYGPIDVWKHVGTVEASTSSTQIDPIPTA